MGFFIKGKMEREEPQKTHAPHGGVLAVWGSPGSGKTTVSVKLAQYLTSKGNNCILIFADMTTPSLAYICRPDDLIEEKSLGSILAAAHVTDELVKRNCSFHKNNKYLSMVGMLKGENRFTYPPYEQEQAKELLIAAEELAPFVIIDCSSHISTNLITGNALMMADSVIRLCGCDLKAVSYFNSQLPLLSDTHKFDADRHICVASNVLPNQAAREIEKSMGSIRCQIPHSLEIETQFLEGDMLKDYEFKESRAFRKAIEAVSKEVFGI